MKCGWCKSVGLSLDTSGMLEPHSRVIPGGTRACMGQDETVIYNIDLSSEADD